MTNSKKPKFRDLISNPGLLVMLFMGMACGFPLALTASTLKTWIATYGISMREVGAFAFVAMPYSLKFLWSPFIDGVRIPFLHKKFGQRRSWLFLIQSLMVVAIFLLAQSEPDSSLLYCAVLATIVSFLSASQDIVVDAYRIEKLPVNLQSMGVTMYIYGYRIGLYISGAALLIIAGYSNWHYAYYVGGIIMALALLVTMLSSEPIHKAQKELKGYHEHLTKMIIEPFKNFTQTSGWYYLLLFIILFKLGDAVAGNLTQPFLIKTGFSLPEIALIVKTYGLPSTLFGTFIGGIVVHRYGLIHSLIFAAIIQMLSNGMFIIQDHIGHNNLVLIATITIENVCSGIGDVVFVGYISSLCNLNFAATQYALLSSFATIGRNFISGTLGFVVDDYGWTMFFIVSMIAALPGLLMILKIRNIKRTQ
jgi:PAT family beta-lactamase induction signal transducer AmpG